MSRQVEAKNVLGDPVIQLIDNNNEQVGRFHKECECIGHGNSLHFTDYTGADNCIDCVRERIEANE